MKNIKGTQKRKWLVLIQGFSGDVNFGLGLEGVLPGG